MSVKIYIRDNTSGKVHEYGTNPYDALILQEDCYQLDIKKAVRQ